MAAISPPNLRLTAKPSAFESLFLERPPVVLELDRPCKPARLLPHPRLRHSTRESVMPNGIEKVREALRQLGVSTSNY